MTLRSRNVRTLTVSLLTAATLFVLPVMGAAPSNPALSKSAVVLEKAPEVISSNARTYLAQRDGENAVVWVFFTDKGIRSHGAFQSAAASVSLTDRARNRRARVDMVEPVFADLPVNQSYVAAVEAAGATVRRVSKWLNAVSVEVPMNRLDAIGSLSFVQRITPIAKFKKTYDLDVAERPEMPDVSQASPDALNYGPSGAQLTQITVPAVHTKGYNGQGVTLAIFDTGFRKTHEAFALHYTEGRVLAEHDFIFNDGNTANEVGDASNQWDHGTYIWSVSGGYKDGSIYGPAYKANFILCKTEDVRSETPVEEDNWVAALEWVDSIGADVITSSLGYSDWYAYSDMDGNTATITLASNTAAGLGIVHCNSMGNDGPGAGTLSAPADAFDMLAVGAVSSTGAIASFSSRGPTYDGRVKPEVCARGVSTYCANTASNISYGTANGTSLSTPLVAGAACLLVQAHPTWPPTVVRQALMETASKAASPDNTYGRGIINTDAALSWGSSFSADVQVGKVPLAVQFTDESTVPATSVMWDFGDGNTSSDPSPAHSYTVPGLYDVSLVRQTTFGELSNERVGYVLAHADSVWYGPDSLFAGQSGVLPVVLTNTHALPQMVITLQVAPGDVPIIVDSITFGTRTAYFEAFNYLQWDDIANRYAIQLVANIGGGSPDLAPGSGDVLRLYYSTDPTTLGSLSTPIDTALYPSTRLLLTASTASYEPTSVAGAIQTKWVLRSDMSRDGKIDLTDLSMLISYLVFGTPVPVALQAADFNASYLVDLTDLSMLIGYLVGAGGPPVNP